MCLRTHPISGLLLATIPLLLLSRAALATGPPKQVAVIASPHFSANFGPGTPWSGLDALIDRLIAFRPDVVFVEELPGEQIGLMLRGGDAHQAALEAFAAGAVRRGRLAQGALELDDLTARAKLPEALERATRSPGDETLAASAMLAAAAYENTTAILLWSKMSPEYRQKLANVPTQLISEFNADSKSYNERIRVGLRIARELNHQRVYGIDDQIDVPFQVVHGQQLMSELKGSSEYEKLQQSELILKLPRRLRETTENGTFLDLFRWMNSAEFGRMDVDTQWNIFLRTRLPSGLDRARIVWWEARNARMAANIAAVMADPSHARGLVVVGASHKTFLDRYLASAMGIEVVDVAELLR